MRLPREIMDKARGAARASGGSVTETADRAAALEGAHVVYAKEWGTTTLLRRRRGAMRGCAPSCRIGACASAGSRGAAPDAKLMHCLPVRRNVAVSDEVLDGPRAVVKREAFNRLVVQMAVLHRMLA